MRKLLLNEDLYDEHLIDWSKELSIKPLSRDKLSSKKLLFISAVYDFPSTIYVFEDSIIIPDVWFGEKIS